MNARLLDQCELCGNRNLEKVLDLGSSPPTCAMFPVGRRPATEEHHPLEVLYCGDCTLGQLSVIVDPEVSFSSNYPYSSGNSKALHDNFEELASEIEIGPDDLVVDIGANDGTLLSKFDCCWKVAVEPTGQAENIYGGTDVFQAFFTQDLAKAIREKHGPAQVVTACNVLAHVDDLHDVMAGVQTLLADDGVFVAENHDLASVVDGQWDAVYHEHLRFWSPHSFYRLLQEYRLGATSWKEIPTHGGSFRMLAVKGLENQGFPPPRPGYDFELLSWSTRAARSALRDEAAGVWGIGATARATTIINYCGLDVEDVECVCEVAGSDKIGRYIPGTRIPVVDEAKLFECQPDSVILFSWHLADVIVPKLREHGYTGEVILPLPTLEIV